MGRRLALLIATHEYQDPELRGLTAPASDAESLAEVLSDEEIAGFEVTTLVNEPHHVVGEAIGDLYRARRRGDLTLLYFTGHGLKDDHGHLYLALANTRRTSLLFTALSAAQIDQAMTGATPHRQVLILDCCYSGAFPPGRLAKADPAVHTLEKFSGRGRTVLTASDATQYSFEGDTVHGSATRSVFTHHLVTGLRDGAADLDGDGDITLDELYSYVHDRVVAELPQQRPKKQANVEGRTVIARNVNWRLPGYLTNALTSPIPAIRLSALEGLEHLHRIGNATVRAAVEETLATLTDDDSRQVSAAATSRLAALRPPEPPAAEPLAEEPSAADPPTAELPAGQEAEPTAAEPPGKPSAIEQPAAELPAEELPAAEAPDVGPADVEQPSAELPVARQVVVEPPAAPEAAEPEPSVAKPVVAAKVEVPESASAGAGWWPPSRERLLKLWLPIAAALAVAVTVTVVVIVGNGDDGGQDSAGTSSVAGQLGAMAIDPYGHYLYTSSYPPQIKKIEATTGQIVARSERFDDLTPGLSSGLAVTPDGSRLFAAGLGPGIKVFATDMMSLADSKITDEPVTAVAVAGRQGYAATEDAVIPFDTDTTEPRNGISVDLPTTDLVFARDGKHLYVASATAVQIVETTTDKVTATIPMCADDITLDLTGTHLIALCAQTGKVASLDLTTKSPSDLTAGIGVTGIGLSSDGQVYLSRGADGVVDAIDPATGEQTGTTDVPDGPSVIVEHRLSDRLFVATREGTITTIDTAVHSASELGTWSG